MMYWRSSSFRYFPISCFILARVFEISRGVIWDDWRRNEVGEISLGLVKEIKGGSGQCRYAFLLQVIRILSSPKIA